MRILSVNTGSSSIKLHLVEHDGGVGRIEHATTADSASSDSDRDAIDAFAAEVGRVDAIAHRVVHGGAYDGPRLVDDEVLSVLQGLVALAPLHQPRAVAAIGHCREMLAPTPNVACFDTAFHRTMAEGATTFALPAEWRRRWPIQRYGFHGLSHEHAVTQVRALIDARRARRIVTCHLGSGSSLCASLDGRSVDTTMGFTPTDGLVMGTRSGAVDPGLVTWLLRQGLTLDELDDGLNHHGGLAGLCGHADFRDVLVAVDAGDTAAALALEVMTHRLVGLIASMVAALGGIDVLAFTGGIGEHASALRAEVADRLGYLGVAIDQERNRASTDADLTAVGAAVSAVVVAAHEELVMARQAAAVVGARP